MSEHRTHFVPAGDGTLALVLEDGCPECAQTAIDQALAPSAPIDWPARFRRAAEVAEGSGRPQLAAFFGDAAFLWPHLPVKVRDELGRALAGEE